MSTAILLLLSLAVFFATESSYALIEKASLWVRNNFGYYYLYLGLGCVLFLLLLAISPLGRIRLGPGKSPEHSLWAWSAMLYSAGMGAGILLRAVQEPVTMWQKPPYPSEMTAQILALEYTFYQWGFTAWAFYGLFAVIIGYMLFVNQRKVRVSSTIPVKHPGLKYGLDLLTIITTVFGLIAAIGLGTTQIHGGLDYLTGMPSGLWMPLCLVSLISGIALISVWKGVDRGIKVLSKYNIALSLGLLAYLFFQGDEFQALSNLFVALGHYLVDFVPMSLTIPPMAPDIAFLTDWTFYYWAFWLAWAPFTGIFIARISKGRSLRQLILGVLFIPSLGTFFWFSVFGTAAFDLIHTWDVYQGEFENVFTSLFIFLGHYPHAWLLNGVSLLLLVGFLVTSVDSAVFVLSMFTDGGRKNPSRKHRLIWSVFILVATLAIIVLGNAKPETDVLEAVQKLLIVTSLPFSFLILIMAAAFFRDAARKGKD